MLVQVMRNYMLEESGLPNRSIASELGLRYMGTLRLDDGSAARITDQPPNLPTMTFYSNADFAPHQFNRQASLVYCEKIGRRTFSCSSRRSLRFRRKEITTCTSAASRDLSVF